MNPPDGLIKIAETRTTRACWFSGPSKNRLTHNGRTIDMMKVRLSKNRSVDSYTLDEWVAIYLSLATIHESLDAIRRGDAPCANCEVEEDGRITFHLRRVKRHRRPDFTPILTLEEWDRVVEVLPHYGEVISESAAHQHALTVRGSSDAGVGRILPSRPHDSTADDASTSNPGDASKNCAD